MLFKRKEKLVLPRNIKTIIDVGAFHGESAIAFCEACPDADIYCFEPLEESYATLQENVCGMRKVSLYPLALGDRTERKTMHRMSRPDCSSLLPLSRYGRSVYPNLHSKSLNVVEMTTMDTVFSGKTLSKDVLVKIDTQGTELQVIQGGRETLKQVALVIVETEFRELYAGQALFGKVYAALARLGFEYRGPWATKNKQGDGVGALYQDSMFVRKGYGDATQDNQDHIQAV